MGIFDLFDLNVSRETIYCVTKNIQNITTQNFNTTKKMFHVKHSWV